jgi:hypothetical protein
VLFAADVSACALLITFVSGAEVREAMAPLKHKDVIAVRSDVARTASEVRTDQKEVANVISKLQAYSVS